MSIETLKQMVEALESAEATLREQSNSLHPDFEPVVLVETGLAITAGKAAIEQAKKQSAECDEPEYDTEWEQRWPNAITPPPEAPVQEKNIGALGMPVNVPVTPPGFAPRSADSAESFCKQCHGLGYYDEGHENDDGSMSGGNYVDCEKCKPLATDDNTEEMLIDCMRSTMAVAWGYLWHITTSDKRVIGARKMLLDMIEASGLTPEEFHKIKTYGIHTAKAEGCVANMSETNWMG